MEVMLVGGTGALGRQIAANLLAKEDVHLTLLARADNPDRPDRQAVLQALTERGATVVQGDVEDPASLDDPLQGIETVVSALSGFTKGVPQANLLHAAQRAGVRRFIPSLYGYDFRRVALGENALTDLDIQAAQAVEASGIPYTFVLCGLFTESLLNPFFGVFDFDNRRVSYWGDGNTPLDVTSMWDVAQYTAEAVVDPTPGNTVLEVAGDVVSFNDIARLYEEVKGRSLTVESKGDEADLAAWIQTAQAEHGDNLYAYVTAQFQLPIIQGRTRLQHLANDKYPSIRPQTVREYIESLP